MAGTYCKTCKYFLIETNAQMGSCRRFPTYQNRHSTEWCGEFSVLNHYDLPDTIENLVIAEEKKEANETRNKGGRPRKVTRV